MATRAIRGATTAFNTEESILLETKELLLEIISVNKLEIEDIASILFTMTADLDKIYPAVVAREIGIVEAGLFCVSELKIENSLEKVIRVLFTINSDAKQSEMKHIYLKEAKKLRPDLSAE